MIALRIIGNTEKLPKKVGITLGKTDNLKRDMMNKSFNLLAIILRFFL